MENQELINKAFRALNSYKRSRTMAEEARNNKDMDTAKHHQLKQFKEIDRLELALRALQSNERYGDNNDDNEEEDDNELEKFKKTK